MSSTLTSRTECLVPKPEEGKRCRLKQGFFTGSRRRSRRQPAVLWGVFLAVVCLASAATCAWRPAWRQIEVFRAQQALESRDFARAESILRNVHERLSPTAETLFLQGCAVRRQGKLLAANVCFDLALELGWDIEEIERQRLFSAAQCGDIRVVEPRLLNLMDTLADDDVAEQCYEAMAQGYVSCMQPGRAAECISYWKDWQPTNPQPWYWEGVVHEGGEAWQDALASYTRACNADANHLAAMLGRARMELETAQVDQAEAHFQQCRQLSPDDPDAALGLAACLVNRGLREAAKKMLREVLILELHPHQTAAALSELGQLELEDGAVAAAAWSLTKAVDYDPISPRCRLVLAAALEQLGETEMAEEQRKAGHELSQQQVQMTNIVRRVRVNPENADVRAEAGAMFLKLGMERDAARWFETAVQIDPNHQASRRGLASIAAKRGDRAGEMRHQSFIAVQADSTPTFEASGAEGIPQ